MLIVEDDEGIREMLQLILGLEGYDVHAAANGEDGLAVLATMPRPCLILLDLMMPVMNGWEFAAALAKNEAMATIPLVLVTAFASSAEGIKPQHTLKKPIDLDALLEVVKRYCG